MEQKSEFGKSLRKKTPRSSQSEWNEPSDRRDPVDILIKSNKGRLEDLIPVRFGRMMKSPFAFLRGAASVMASDLSYTSSSGINVQCCGDCHLVNFGAFATPERNMVFEINDFDETHEAPWEWDLKRLTTSFVVAGRYRKFHSKIIKKAALASVRSYRENMTKYSSMRTLDVWYSRIDEGDIKKIFADDEGYIKRLEKFKDKARSISNEIVLPKNVKIKEGIAKIADEKPFIYHSDDISTTNANNAKMKKFFDTYKRSLNSEKQTLFDRFEFSDVAYRVAGVGSVGTRCYIALFMGENNDALLLQVKEARKSVLEPYTQKSGYKDDGERIVSGQRLMQAASDIFLGWTKADDGKNFYVRQLRDMKIETDIDAITPDIFMNYAALCGRSLAKSHSKAGEAAAISGYLGTSEEFDEAITEFAFKYAERNEEDYDQFCKAREDGIIQCS